MSDFVNNPVPTIQEEVIALKLENEQLKCDLYNTEANLQSMTVNYENLEKENESNELALNEGKEIIAELEGQNKILTKRILELQKTCGTLTDRVEKMKKNCLDVMRVQEDSLTDDYMAGMYNGMVVVYNSCFLKDNELAKSCCSKNEYNKWESEV